MLNTPVKPAMPAPEEAESLLRMKADMAAQTVDKMLFTGPMAAIAAAMGLPTVSTILLPMKDANLRRYLYSVSEIMKAVLDDQVPLEGFTPVLVEGVQAVRATMEEERKENASIQATGHTRRSANSLPGKNRKR